MNNDDENELGLAPNDDEDLQLVPVDDDAGKEIAPEISHKSGIRLIPVICSACRTRLYAGENQVGLWKRCPVCERLNKIYPVDPKFILTADDPEAEDGYEVSEPEISKREMFRINADYRNLDSSGKKEKVEDGDFFLSPISSEKQPLMDRMLDRFLKSDEENKEEQRALKREEKIQKELEGIKKAVREGKLEEHLSLAEKLPSKTSVDLPGPVERKLVEKQRVFEAAQAEEKKIQENKTRNRTDDQSTNSQKKPENQSIPPVIQREQRQTTAEANPEAVLAALDAAIETVQKTERNDNLFDRGKTDPSILSFQQTGPSQIDDGVQTNVSFWSPFFDPRASKRLIALAVFGFVGNLFGEKARSMIWQILIDKVHGQSPGYSYNLSENIVLLSSFWVGGVLSVVWFALIFLYGISVFEASSKGKNRVEYWMPFNLDFGLSYVGWTLLILYLSSLPGQILWFGVDTAKPEYGNLVLTLQPLLLFLIFPILYLCVIESETFFGCFPRKTLQSFLKDPKLWLHFLGKAFVLLGIPVLIFSGWSYLGLRLADYWIMQSLLYYLIAAALLTFAGFAVLFYFRLLGLMANDIRRSD